MDWMTSPMVFVLPQGTTGFAWFAAVAAVVTQLQKALRALSLGKTWPKVWSRAMGPPAQLKTMPVAVVAGRHGTAFAVTGRNLPVFFLRSAASFAAAWSAAGKRSGLTLAGAALFFAAAFFAAAFFAGGTDFFVAMVGSFAWWTCRHFSADTH